MTYSKGFIEKADIVSQNQANGLFQVNIRAKVKRQQLLEQAKANNINVKAVEGVSLHAQVESQLKQEKDAKALLEKALLPLMGTTFHRAELVPSTTNQPNPTINKTGTDDQFVTLDYKVSLWIDESEYYKYVKNSLIPVLNQIATHKGELTANYSMTNGGIININGRSYASIAEENKVLNNKEEELSNDKEFSVSVLIWKDKGLTSSKWQWFFISKDQVPEIYKLNYESSRGLLVQPLCRKAIELSLMDEKNEMVALGAITSSMGGCYRHEHPTVSNSPIAVLWEGHGKIRISPYFSAYWHSQEERRIVPPKSENFSISVKISKEDLPRVKSAKLEVKPAGGE